MTLFSEYIFARPSGGAHGLPVHLRHSEMLCFIFSKRAHDQPIDGQKDDDQECPSVKQHGDRKCGIGAGEQTMQRGAEVTEQAQEMNGAECLRPDSLAQIECEGDQQQYIKAGDPEPHPKRTIGIGERHENLEQAEWQVTIEQQDEDMHDHKAEPEQRKIFMEIISVDVL